MTVRPICPSCSQAVETPATHHRLPYHSDGTGSQCPGSGFIYRTSQPAEPPTSTGDVFLGTVVTHGAAFRLYGSAAGVQTLVDSLAEGGLDLARGMLLGPQFRVERIQ